MDKSEFKLKLLADIRIDAVFRRDWLGRMLAPRRRPPAKPERPQIEQRN